MTVRVWDAVQKPSDKGAGAEASTVKVDAAATAGGAAQQKKSKKDVVVTQDQISAFATKKSPVYRVGFTRSNLVLAGGAYLPELY